MNAIYVGWLGRPLGTTETFGVSPVLSFGRELKQLCKPLQKCSYEMRTRPQGRNSQTSRRALRLATALNLQRFPRARATSEPDQLAPVPAAEQTIWRPGESCGATVGLAGCLGHGLPSCRLPLLPQAGSRT